MRYRSLGLAYLGLLTLALPGCPGEAPFDAGADVRDARRDTSSQETGGQDVPPGNDVALDQGAPDVFDAGGADAADVPAVLDADAMSPTDVVDVPDAMDAMDVVLPDASPGDAADVTLPDVVPATGTLVFLATGGTTVYGGVYTPAGGWTVGDVGGASDNRPAVAMTGAASAVGLIRSRSNGGELLFLEYDAGTWSPFAPLGTGITTRAEPAITADLTTGRADAVFHGDDFKHYFASYTTTWLPTAEPVGPSGNQSFGPTPATIAESSTGPVVAFEGNNLDVYAQARVAGVWQVGDPQGVPNSVRLSPTIASLAGGGLMVAWVRDADAQVMYATSPGATGPWSTPAPVPSALSNNSVALVGTADGAALAFRGLDLHVYATRYTPTGSPAWSAPIQPPRSDASADSPALAPGVGAAAAELLYASNVDHAVHHCRLVGASWNNCNVAGGVGVTAVAASSAP